MEAMRYLSTTTTTNMNGTNLSIGSIRRRLQARNLVHPLQNQPLFILQQLRPYSNQSLGPQDAPRKRESGRTGR